jgi:hypothetical protein
MARMNIVRAPFPHPFRVRYDSKAEPPSFFPIIDFLEPIQMNGKAKASIVSRNLASPAESLSIRMASTLYFFNEEMKH